MGAVTGASETKSNGSEKITSNNVNIKIQKGNINMEYRKIFIDTQKGTQNTYTNLNIKIHVYILLYPSLDIAHNKM